MAVFACRAWWSGMTKGMPACVSISPCMKRSFVFWAMTQPKASQSCPPTDLEEPYLAFRETTDISGRTRKKHILCDEKISLFLANATEQRKQHRLFIGPKPRRHAILCCKCLVHALPGNLSSLLGKDKRDDAFVGG